MDISALAVIMTIQTMKNNKKKNTPHYTGEGQNFKFRKVKEKFYAGRWFMPNEFVPVIPNNDTKYQYFVKLSEDFSFFLDKSILYDEVLTHYLFYTEYQKYVESDWENFKPRNNFTQQLYQSNSRVSPSNNFSWKTEPTYDSYTLYKMNNSTNDYIL